MTSESQSASVVGTTSRAFSLPPAVIATGPRASERFLEFFAAAIRNAGTRESYARATAAFLSWTQNIVGPSLREITPLHVATYIEQMGATHARPTVKRHLAAIRSLFDWMVAGGVLSSNPAAPVRGPRHVVTRGSTPVLTASETRLLLDSITTSTLIGLRDRALISLMVYTFARVSAAVGLRVGDYYAQGKRWWVRLNEKNGRLHQVPVHSQLEGALDSYLDAISIGDDAEGPLFRSFTRHGQPTCGGMSRHDAGRMIKRRAAAAGLSRSTCCHSFRATGITTFLQNGGTLENAQAIAGHSSARTTSLYDRRAEDIALGEIERIVI